MVSLIEDYGMIGDGHSAALVSREGSLDWLCWPRFDSDACFASLLGTAENGSWRISPMLDARHSRRYQRDTLVLETEFETDTGRALLIDFMPIRRGDPLLIRIVRGLDGVVSFRSTMRLRFDYGAVRPWISRESEAMIARVGPDMAVLHAPADWDEDDGAIVSEFQVRAGEDKPFVLAYAASTKPPPEPVDPQELLRTTNIWWREWIGRFDRSTEWPEVVRRSLITLKAMIYQPTGGIVAAPTTSLPETPGGEWNWDYRYCWLRDATQTLSSLINAGYRQEAESWRNWLLRAVAGDPDKMRIMYRIDGARRLDEWLAPWLSGFRSAEPVRIGNAAVQQFQLDVYGELMDVLHLSELAEIESSEQARHLEHALIEHVARVWRKPDKGFWEPRGKPRQHVYSKVSAWVAVDRAIKMRERRSDGSDVQSLRTLRGLIKADICREGYDQGLGSFVSYYGAREVDASLLLLPIVGFLPVQDPRIAGTLRRIEAKLVSDGLVRRMEGGERDKEGAFLACTCWLAECQAREGRIDEARTNFERVLATANDLGLFSEEYDLEAQRMAGNFPQALTHLAVLETALKLSGPVLQRGGDPE